jgi:hypothetical protein
MRLEQKTFQSSQDHNDLDEAACSAKDEYSVFDCEDFDESQVNSHRPSPRLDLVHSKFNTTFKDILPPRSELGNYHHCKETQIA